MKNALEAVSSDIGTWKFTGLCYGIRVMIRFEEDGASQFRCLYMVGLKCNMRMAE